MRSRGIGALAAAWAAVAVGCSDGAVVNASGDAGGDVAPTSAVVGADGGATDASSRGGPRADAAVFRAVVTPEARVDGGPSLSADAGADGGGAPSDASTSPPTESGTDPPPLSGGTLAISADGSTAVVADPDDDRVLVVDLRSRAHRAVALTRGDEPGRVAIDGRGRAHVALRRGGALVTIDLATATVTSRRAACALPRGVAWDPETDDVHVVCASGELVTFPAAGGAARRAYVAPDLRDVVVQGDRLIVTRLRAAETLVTDRAGVVTQRFAAPAAEGERAGVAWRAVPARDGGAWLLHQRYGDVPVRVVAGGYGSFTTSECSSVGVVRAGLARVRPPVAPTRGLTLTGAPLAVDLAVDATGARVAFAVPGNAGGERSQLTVSSIGDGPCAAPSSPFAVPLGQVVAVAYTPAGALVAQTRAPSRIYSAAGVIELGGEPHAERGHRLFHANPTGLVTCASCHVEGDDDGRVWTFSDVGARRTQYLRGGILGSEPFHWSGDQSDFAALVSEVLVRRMSAPTPTPADVIALAGWIDRLPTLPGGVSDDPDAVTRGEAIFRSDATNCAGCHSGPRFSNGEAVDVGTGGRFQVPTLLGLRWRAPYLHDGRAATLRDRFAPSGGGEMHGHTAQLTDAQVDDLVAYLESL